MPSGPSYFTIHPAIAAARYRVDRAGSIRDIPTVRWPATNLGSTRLSPDWERLWHVSPRARTRRMLQIDGPDRGRQDTRENDDAERDVVEARSRCRPRCTRRFSKAEAAARCERHRRPHRLFIALPTPDQAPGLAIPIIIGFGYSLFGAQLALRPLFAVAYQQLGGLSARFAGPWHPAAIGYIERSLFTSAWLAGRPEFAAVWLALKVAGQWGRWQGDIDRGRIYVPGRAVYNLLLIGSGLSLMFAFAGGILIDRIANRAWIDAVAVATGPVLLTLFLWAMATGRFTALSTPKGPDADRAAPSEQPGSLEPSLTQPGAPEDDAEVLAAGGPNL